MNIRTRLFFLGICLSLTAAADTFYVDASQADNSGAGTNWTTAKATIQAAVDLATAGDTVLVADGMYTNGTRTTPKYDCLNRLVITRDIAICSVNGPADTFIVGMPDPDTDDCGTNAVRGVYMSAGFLSGFTITNGYTMSSGNTYYDCNGGGINFRGGNGVASNCVLSGNSASDKGGGSAYGTLIDCAFTGNSAECGGGSCSDTLTDCIFSGNSAHYGGGSYYSTLNNCTLSGNFATWSGGGSRYGTLSNCMLSSNSVTWYGGGGSDGSTLYNCTLTGNSATWGGGSNFGKLYSCTLCNNSANAGGGSHKGTLNNCTIYNNFASGSGGGSDGSTLNNCTIFGNSASTYGGGSYEGTLNNCIVWGNTAPFNFAKNTYMNTVRYVCSPDFTGSGGSGCIGSNPLFVDAANGDFRLQPGSPCIDAGSNETASGDTDLVGNDRMIHDTVDMGAYEYAGFITDTDGDSQNDYDEYVAGTCETNAGDCFRITSISNGAVCFQSLDTRRYTLYSTTNLTDGVWTAVTNRMGIGGADSMQGSGSDQEYFKLEVELP